VNWTTYGPGQITTAFSLTTFVAYEHVTYNCSCNTTDPLELHQG